MAKGKDLLWEFGLEPKKKLVVIQPGGGALNKCWNVENYLSIVNKLRSKNTQVVFLLGPAELERFSNDMIQTLVYLNLSVGGHLTVFVARTRGPVWSVRPANILLMAVVGTQILATFIAVYGDALIQEVKQRGRMRRFQKYESDYIRRWLVTQGLDWVRRAVLGQLTSPVDWKS